MIGGRVWDVDRGDDREDPPGVFCSGEGDHNIVGFTELMAAVQD
jgi:hypothetical protein